MSPADSPERYALLASAIAGRSVGVEAGPVGDPSWTDGSVVYLDPGADRAEAVLSVAVHAAMIGAGSLDPPILRRLGRRHGSPYLLVEGHRALAAVGQLLPSRVGAAVRPDVALLSTSPEDSLRLAAGGGVAGDPPAAFGVIHPDRVRVAASEEQAQTSADDTRSPDPSSTEVGELPDDEPGLTLDLLSSPVGGSGVLGRLLARMMGEGRSDGSGSPGADPATRWSRTRPRAEGATTSTVSTVPLREATEVVAPTGSVYPEWDCHRRAYRPAWCTVSEVTPPPPEAVTPIRDAHGLRRSLSRLGLEFDRRRRQADGDDIDVDAAVSTLVDLRSGHSGRDDVYIDSARRRRDLAVLILLDVSGSAGEPSRAGAAVHDHQKAAAASLVAALHGLADRVALYGFRSRGRSFVEVLPVLGFGEKPGLAAAGRLESLTPAAYTRLGAAVRHGTAVLEAEALASRRLLVVLSDGFAYDHGYERAYGEADARRALAEAGRRGIGCLCLSVGAGTDAASLRRVFGTAAHAQVGRAGDLAGVIGPLFRAALRSAGLQQRRWNDHRRSRARIAHERMTV